MEQPTLPEINQDVVPDKIGGLASPLSQDIRPIEIPSIPTGISGGGGSAISTPVLDQPEGTKNIALTIKDQIKNPEAYAVDPYYKAKNWSYDADHTGKNFARYYNVPTVYKKLGFSPWRDNETAYNKEMSWWDDYKRSMGQMVNLAGASYVGTLPWNAWGDPTDEVSAEAMNRANAIGYSSRPGLGGFINNLSLNAGFTVGMLGEFFTEEVGLQAVAAIATPFTKGKSEAMWAEYTGARAGKLLKDMGTLGRFGNQLGKSLKSLTSIKDLEKAREFFNASKIGKGVVKTFTPHTVDAVNDLIRGSKAGENLGTIAKVSKTFGAFYRDTREVTAALSEARMEGGMAEQELFDKLYKNYKDTHDGKVPSAEEYARMMENAYNAGHETYWWNVPALYLSNKIVFDKAFRGFTPVKDIRLAFRKAVTHDITWNKALAIVGEGGYELMDKSVKETLKRMKSPSYALRALAKGAKTYGKANLTEGIQEIYQDAMSASMKSYYEEIYKDPLKTSIHSPWGHIARNAKYQLTSKQGFETFASGFLMGGLIQVPQHIFYHSGVKKFHEIFNKEDYNIYKAQRKQEALDVVNALNAATKDPMRFADMHLENLVVQKNIQNRQLDASALNNLKGFRDDHDDAMFNHIDTLMRTGHIDTVIDNLNQMKKLSGEELIQAYGPLEEADGDPKAYYTKKIDEFSDRAKKIKARYDEVDKLFINPFNPMRFNPETQREKHVQETNYYLGFENAKKLAVYAGYSFDQTLRRMKSIVNKATTNKAVAAATSHDFAITFTPRGMSDEAKRMRQEISAMEGVPGEARELNKKKKSLEKLKAFHGAVEKFRTVLGKISNRKELDDTTEMTEEETKVYAQAHEMLKDTYFDYVKNLADINEESVLDSNIENAFTDLADYYHVENDHTNLADTVNMLHNPQYFRLYADRAAKVFQSLHEQRLDLFKASYEQVLNSQELNDLINVLLNLGVYFNPSQLEQLKKGERPTELFSVKDGDKIPEDSELYKKAMAVFDQYKVSKEGPKTEPAKPTVTEREVQENEVLPMGSEVRMDMETGKNYVKETVVEAVPEVAPEVVVDVTEDPVTKQVNKLKEDIANVKNNEELARLSTVVDDMMLRGELDEEDAQGLYNQIDQRKVTLTTDFTFDDLTEGKVIATKDGKLYIIVEHSKDKIVVQDYKTMKEETFTPADMDKFARVANMQGPVKTAPVQPVSTEEKTISNTNVENMKQEDTAEKVKRLSNEVKDLADDQVELPICK
jgi:hypothetical protein